MTGKYVEENALGYDLETPLGCFLASFYDIKENVWYDFLINKYQNDLLKFVNFLHRNKHKYFISFNGINFDNQVIEWIYRNYEKWYDLTGEEIAEKIYIYASKVIDDNNYGLFLPYREEHFTFTPIDVPRILHWFNDNKRVSLKQAEFELRAENIENFEIAPDKKDFTPEEIQDLIFYCHNDVKYTVEIFKVVIGETDHPLYKGKDKIFDRFTILKEVGLPCLNWDDVKIGSEWNKKDYIKATGRDESQLKPQKVNHFFGKKYKVFFPKTVEFQTVDLQAFVGKLGNTFVLNEKQEFKYRFNDTLTVTIARGGLHSNEKPRFLQPKEDEIFLQNDIGSQYPNAMRKYGVFPKHLGEAWNHEIPVKINRRLNNKKLYKQTKEPKFNSLQEMGKLQLNGGLYGKLNSQGDWQQDPCCMLQVTMGCQLEILMIVEALILKGFNITSCNTDGWDCIIPRNRLEEYFGIVEYYEEKIGNKELGNVEYTEFGWMAQTSVNDYAAEKVGVWEKRQFIEDRIVQKGSLFPHLKLKGDFCIDIDLHKNSSFLIKPLALAHYFDKEIEPDEYISKHDNIFDFCARSNSGNTYYHEGYEGNNTFKLPKLIRYYVANEGIHIKKIVKPDIESNANDTGVVPSEYPKVVCNRLPKDDYERHLQNVNRQWYIDEVRTIILSIQRGKKLDKKRKKVDPNQISLF